MGNSLFIFIYFTLGLFMSTLSTTLFGFIGTPTMPELIYIPLLYIRRHDFVLEKQCRNTFIIFIFFWIAMICIAVINQRYDLSAIFTTARSYLYVGTFAILAYNLRLDKKFYQVLLLLSAGSVSGWMLVDFLQMIHVLPQSYLNITYGNTIAIPLLVSIAFALFRNILLLLFCLVSNIFLSLTTSLRRQMVISVFALVVSYVLQARHRGSFKLHLIVIISALTFAAALPQIEKQIYQFSPVTYHRVFSKTKSLLNGEKSKGDKIRGNMMEFLSERMYELHIPHGFVSKRTRSDEGTGLYIDYPLYELLYTFGSIPVLLGFLYLIFKILYHFFAFTRSGKPDTIVWIVSASACVILLFLDSTFITYTYISPMTGIVLGIIGRPSI